MYKLGLKSIRSRVCQTSSHQSPLTVGMSQFKCHPGIVFQEMNGFKFWLRDFPEFFSVKYADR